MTTSQKLQVRRAEITSRLNAIAALEGDAFTDEIRSEGGGLRTELAALDEKLASALSAEPVGIQGQEGRELKSLLERASLGDMVDCIRSQSEMTGREMELCRALGVTPGHIPVEMFPGLASQELGPDELRAVTPPGNVSANEQPGRAFIFGPSLLDFMGIDRPSVASGSTVMIATSQRAGYDSPAVGTAHSTTAGAFASTVTNPKLIQASYEYQSVDSVKHSQMEGMLRRSLTDSLQDAMTEIVVDAIFASNGPLVTAPSGSAPSAVVSYASALTDLYSAVDGRQADSVGSVRMVVNPLAYRVLGGTLGTASDRSALAELMALGGGVRTSEHMPAEASDVSPHLLVRGGGYGSIAMPVYRSVRLIFDEITSLSTGGVKIVATLYHGGPVALRQDGYQRSRFKTS